MARQKVLILGAAGRDFHNFNVVYRDDPQVEVVGFTATQIPDIAGRRYPPELAGPLYPDGIPIYDEADLTEIVRSKQVDLVIFAYSDVSHEHVMHLASEAMAAGADFGLLGPRRTMLKSRRPVVAVCAVRTGSGKSQTSRLVVDLLQEMGQRVVAIRHPMPYGDLAAQRVQRFGDYSDLDRHNCTVEEREEYEPYLERGVVVYAGVDYAEILAQAEEEADVIVWDGGNNDFSFLATDLYITVADPHRVGHETTYHPGETNLRLADVVIVNKIDSAPEGSVDQLTATIGRVNPRAQIILAESPITVDRPDQVAGRKVLVVEDGPTLTHGEMGYGAGTIAARRLGAAELVDPRQWAVGSIAETFEKYPHIGTVLPALGYGHRQLEELEKTIDACPVDVVLSATPIDLGRLISTEKPILRARYELDPKAGPDLRDLLYNLVKD